ncbi:cytochrome oxidase assembly, partial [Atractiella rhizophila]
PPPAPPKFLHRHLYVTSALTLSIVLVGGLTRLTESGLSITEWNLVTGTLPPIGAKAWQEEFEKYKGTPEFEILNKWMGVDDFKRIYYMEWGHRLLGRVIGLTFLLPLPFYLRHPYFTSSAARFRRNFLPLLGIGALIGAQGALGWYMVKSGLTYDDLRTANPSNPTPRVSQYRLAAHMGLAFLVGLLAFRGGLVAQMERAIITNARAPPSLSPEPSVRRMRIAVAACTGLVFTTAMSGAFVAGLDAGLIYNEFPKMGEGIVPPTKELFDPRYERGRGETWRNFFDNPTLVQFDHRVLATSSFIAVAVLKHLPHMRFFKPLSKQTLKALNYAAYALIAQVTLGISTLIYLVPVPLAAAHQLGSCVLLATLVFAGTTLKKP